MANYWNPVLSTIARMLRPDNEQAETELLNSLTGRTEYYVLLHSLWIRVLTDDDDAPLTIDKLYNLHMKTRHTTKSTLQEYVEHLAENKIFEKSDDANDPAYRFSPTFIQVFERYRELLPDLRSRLKMAVEAATSDLGNSNAPDAART